MISLQKAGKNPTLAFLALCLRVEGGNAAGTVSGTSRFR